MSNTKSRSLVYPKHIRPDIRGVGCSWTTPGIFFGEKDDGSAWLRMEITRFTAPTPEIVEEWIRQILTFEIGRKCADMALHLMGNDRASYLQFLEHVRKYYRAKKLPARKQGKK